MTPYELEQWQVSMLYSNYEAALVLGIREQSYVQYLPGGGYTRIDIPLHIERVVKLIETVENTQARLNHLTSMLRPQNWRNEIKDAIDYISEIQQKLDEILVVE